MVTNTCLFNLTLRRIWRTQLAVQTLLSKIKTAAEQTAAVKI